MPTMRDLPRAEDGAARAEQGRRPLQLKAIGEVPTTPGRRRRSPTRSPTPAGARIRDLPMTAEKVYRALRAE